MDTDRLVEQLVAELVPVRRLARPSVRLGWWLLASVPACLLAACAAGLRPDLGACLADPGFVVAEAASFLTACLAIYAALCAVVPDQPGWKLALPLAPLAVWLGTLGRQCLLVLASTGPDGLRVTADLMCVPAIALGGLVPGIAIAVLLRRGGRVRAVQAWFLASLGAAALGALALRLYHADDAAIMVLVWQLGSVGLFSLAGAAFGARRNLFA